MPASGKDYWENRQWLLQQGAHIHPQPVNLFDYKHMLRKNPDIRVPLAFDLIVGFGLCLNVFADAGHLAHRHQNSTVTRQYGFLARTTSKLDSHQQLFNEALMGQCINSTQILIHQARLV